MATAQLDFAALFGALPNALMVLDRELRYVAANEAYLKTTGAQLEQLLGSHVFDAFPNDPADPNSANAKILRASFERVLASGKTDELAAIWYRVPRKAGGPLEDRVWSAKHTPLLGVDGNVAFIVQETADITHVQATTVDAGSLLGATVLDRALRAQAAATTLGAQLASLRQMFDQAPGFVCFLRGPEHVFEFVNPAYLQLVGHREVSGLKVCDALPEVVEQGFITLLDNVYNSGEAFLGKDLFLRLQRTPGAALEDCYVDFIYQPIRDDSGHIVGIFVQGQEVTTQHHAQATAAQLFVRQRFLIESIPVQVWTSTPDGMLDFVSDRALRYFQTTVEEILGTGWLSCLHPDDVAESTSRWNRSVATGEPYEIEFRLRRGDGTYRWHLARASAERGADGTIIGWFGTNTDIDEAKLALAELRARSEYEQRLIGIVSHDLRNPLNSISLAAALLSRRQLDEQTQRTIARISRSADRAARLITDLLDFAKARIGTSIPINPGPTNLREVVEQVVDELQMLAPSRIVRVGHTGAEDGRWDADRIAQVISNLVGNALQHAPADAPIKVESRIEGDDAFFAVTNDGPPIPAAELSLLFEPFKRGHNAAVGPGGSLGLGLYIAREVVIAHGGTIEVDSSIDAGTSFVVRLPRFVAPTTQS